MVKLHRNIEVIDFQDNSNSYVNVTIKNNNNDSGNIEHLTSKYLVGCDGGRSIVRQKLDINFPGNTYDEAFLLTKTYLENDKAFIDELNNYGNTSSLPHFNVNDKDLTNNIVNGAFKGMFVRVGSKGWIFGIALPENKWYIGVNIARKKLW